MAFIPISDRLNVAPDVFDSAINMWGNLNKMRAQRIANRYAPKMNDARLQQLAANTAARQIQNSYLPQQLQENILSARDRNIAQEINNRYLDPINQAKLNMMKEKAKYGGSVNLPGAAGKALALQRLKTAVDRGIVPPETYQHAINAFKADLQNKNLRAQYYKMLTDTSGKRYSTDQGKLAHEETQLSQGIIPTSPLWGLTPWKSRGIGTDTNAVQVPSDPSLAQPRNQKEISISPEIKRWLNQTKLEELKKSGDAESRKRYRYGVNVLTTVNNVNPQKMLHYSGVLGQGKKWAQAALAGLVPGSESQAYHDYMNEVTKASLAAGQVRQYLGDSVKKEKQEELKELTKPEYWLSNPKIATDQFNEFKKIIQWEIQNTRQSNIDANFYLQNPRSLSGSGASASPGVAPARTPQFSDSAIRSYAKKYNMTIPQVKNMLARRANNG